MAVAAAPPTPESLTAQRARLAGATRHRGPNDPAVLVARRDYTADKIAEFVARCVATAPPLTDEQRERIAALLRGSAVEAAAS